MFVTWSPLLSILVCKIPHFMAETSSSDSPSYFLERRHPDVTKNPYYALGISLWTVRVDPELQRCVKVCTFNVFLTFFAYSPYLYLSLKSVFLVSQEKTYDLLIRQINLITFDKMNIYR